MKPLVTKLRKGPLPKAPESPESMSSLFSEAGDAYAPNLGSEQDQEEESEKIKPGLGSRPIRMKG